MTSQQKLAIKKAKINKKIARDSGLGWSLFGQDYQAMDDYSVGMDYLLKYFTTTQGSANAMIARTNYIEALKKKIGNTQVGAQISGLGSGIKLAEMSESDVQSASDALASLSGGRVPSTISEFRQALIDRATEVKWVSWDALKTVSVGIASDVADKAVAVGDGLLNVADSVGESVGFIADINKYVPILIPVVVGVVVWKLGIFGALKNKIAKV